MNLLSGNFFENKTKVYLTLVLVPLCLYFKSLFYDFSPLDDQWMVLKNAGELGNWHNLPVFFAKPVAQVYYRPLLNVSLMIDYQFGGLSPFIYHYTNLLLHLLCVVLLFNFLKLVNTSNKFAFTLALLFSVHPVLLHAVAWIPGRNDLLLSLFMLCSTNSLLNYLRDQKTKHLASHILFFMCALFTKENAFFLLLFFALLGFSLRYSKKQLALLTVAWLLSTISWFLIRQSVVNSHLTAGAHLSDTLKNAALAFLLFTGKTLLPVQQSVFPTLKNASLVPGIVVLVSLAILYFKFRLKNNLLAFSGLLLFVSILAIPVWYSAGKEISEHYEHRLYLPLIGLLLFISQFNVNVNTKLFNYSSLCIILLFGGKTVVRMDVYKNEMTFLGHGIAETPDYFLFHFQKANKLFALKDCNGAIASYNTAIRLQPRRSELYNNRGNVYAFIKKYKQAIADYSKAIELLPNDPQAYINRCIISGEAGDYETAQRDLLFLKQNYPGLIPQELNDNITSTWNDRWLEQLNRKLVNEPKNATLYVKRAKLFLSKQLMNKAFEDIKTACELDPANTEYKMYLARLSPVQVSALAN